MGKTKILMVCLGNICRSPLAEGILKSKLNNHHFIVDSAGTGSWHIGSKPDPRSIDTAKKYGIDISNQRGRQISADDFHQFDYIYVMDNSNYNDVIQIAPDEKSKDKVKLILDELFPNENVDIPDPYYGSSRDFELVFNMLDQACEVIKSNLENLD